MFAGTRACGDDCLQVAEVAGWINFTYPGTFPRVEGKEAVCVCERDGNISVHRLRAQLACIVREADRVNGATD